MRARSKLELVHERETTLIDCGTWRLHGCGTDHEELAVNGSFVGRERERERGREREKKWLNLAE